MLTGHAQAPSQASSSQSFQASRQPGAQRYSIGGTAAAEDVEDGRGVHSAPTSAAGYFARPIFAPATARSGAPTPSLAFAPIQSEVDVLALEASATTPTASPRQARQETAVEAAKAAAQARAAELTRSWRRWIVSHNRESARHEIISGVSRQYWRAAGRVRTRLVARAWNAWCEQATILARLTRRYWRAAALVHVRLVTAGWIAWREQAVIRLQMRRLEWTANSRWQRLHLSSGFRQWITHTGLVVRLRSSRTAADFAIANATSSPSSSQSKGKRNPQPGQAPPPMESRRAAPAEPSPSSPHTAPLPAYATVDAVQQLPGSSPMPSAQPSPTLPRHRHAPSPTPPAVASGRAGCGSAAASGGSRNAALTSPSRERVSWALPPEDSPLHYLQGRLPIVGPGAYRAPPVITAGGRQMKLPQPQPSGPSLLGHEAVRASTRIHSAPPGHRAPPPPRRGGRETTTSSSSYIQSAGTGRHLSSELSPVD